MFSLPDLQASVYNLKTVSRQSSIQSTYMQQLPSLFWHLLTIPHTFTLCLLKIMSKLNWNTQRRGHLEVFVEHTSF